MTHFCWLAGTRAGRNTMATRRTGITTSAHGAHAELMGSRHLHLSSQGGRRKASPAHKEPVRTAFPGRVCPPACWEPGTDRAEALFLRGPGQLALWPCNSHLV